MLAELPRPHPLFFPQLLIASLPKSLSAQWQRCLKAFQICNLIALGRTLVHFQNRCIRLYNSALQKKKKKKSTSHSFQQKCQPLKRGPQQTIQPGLTKELQKHQICKCGSPTPFRTHPSRGPRELFGPETKSPRDTLSYIIYVHATQRGEGGRNVTALAVFE